MEERPTFLRVVGRLLSDHSSTYIQPPSPQPTPCVRDHRSAIRRMTVRPGPLVLVRRRRINRATDAISSGIRPTVVRGEPTFIAHLSLDDRILCSSSNFLPNDVTQLSLDFLNMISHTTNKGNRDISIMATTRNKHIITKLNQANSRRYARTFNTEICEISIACCV
jgi:hypothetical protein